MPHLAALTPPVPVSVVMPVLNEARHLTAAVESVLHNGYEAPVELVIALGPSTDETNAVAESLAAADARVRLVANPTGVTPTGLTLAIDAARYDVIVRIDGHTELPRGYIADAVAALARTGAANVGGRMVPTATEPLARAIAVGMSSRWGVGGAGHRVGGAEGPTESVFLGSFRREALDAVGGFDDHFVRAQDWELNHRLRRAGYTVYFVPTMQVPYAPRRTWKALARQFHHSGRWRAEVVRTYPATRSLRYFAPPVVLVAITLGTLAGSVGLVLGQPWLMAGFAAPLLYLAGLLGASATHARDLPARSLALLPGVLATMHLAWAAGFVRGVR